MNRNYISWLRHSLKQWRQLTRNYVTAGSNINVIVSRERRLKRRLRFVTGMSHVCKSQVPVQAILNQVCEAAKLETHGLFGR